jgi:hypothetical protein
MTMTPHFDAAMLISQRSAQALTCSMLPASVPGAGANSTTSSANRRPARRFLCGRSSPGISTVYPRHLKSVSSAVVQQIVDEDVEKERGCGVALSQSTVDSHTRGS